MGKIFGLGSFDNFSTLRQIIMEVNMSLLQETIVYFWLIPVVAQIIIPLAMLVGWSIKKVLNILSGEKSASTAFAGNDLEPA